MRVFQPSVPRIAVFECGPLLTWRWSGPTRVVRRHGERPALTSGLVDAASNRGISGSPISPEHPLETARRVRSRHLWSVDGGADLVDVGDRPSGWCVVEVELQLEVLWPPLRLPGALASVPFLELPSALLVGPLHEGGSLSLSRGLQRSGFLNRADEFLVADRLTMKPPAAHHFFLLLGNGQEGGGRPRRPASRSGDWADFRSGREVMTHSWPRPPSGVPPCSPRQTPGRSWAPAPPKAA